MTRSRQDNDVSIKGGSKVVPLPTSEEIEMEAAEWLVVLGREDVSAADKLAVRQWLALSDRNQAAFDKLAAIWGDLEALKELRDIAKSVEAPGPVSNSVFSRRNSGALAATLAIMAGGTVIFAGLNNDRVELGEYATAVGGQRSITLSDGSSLHLNTNSHLEIDFSRESRVVRLTQGEAYFDVAKNKKRPFLVATPSGSVEAIGTAFTVHVRPDQLLEVTVEEGRVALMSKSSLDGAGAASALSQAENASEQGPRLAQVVAGQRAVFAEQVEELDQLSQEEMRRDLSWRQGVLVFSGEPLVDVINDISRYTDLRIEIVDPEVSNKSVSGYFRVGEVQALFQSLELSFGIEVQRVGANHVILANAS